MKKLTKDAVGEFHVVYKTTKKDRDFERYNSPLKAAKFAKDIWEDDIEYRERFKVIFLDMALQYVGHAEISSGGVSATVVDPKMVFQHGLMCNASRMVLVHNHPTGNLNPSREDKNLTDKMVKLGEMMSMEVIDHLIITHGTSQCYSFAQQNMV